LIIAKKNTAYYLAFPAIDSVIPDKYKSGITPVVAAYYKDGAGAWTLLSVTDVVAEIASTGIYEIDFTATEFNHDKVLLKITVSGMVDDSYMFDLRGKLVDDLNDITAGSVTADILGTESFP